MGIRLFLFQFHQQCDQTVGFRIGRAAVGHFRSIQLSLLVGVVAVVVAVVVVEVVAEGSLELDHYQPDSRPIYSLKRKFVLM